MDRKYRHIAIMAMAALIGLLGCSRSSGGDDLLEPPTPIPTPTPTPTPEPEPTPDDDETPISFTSGVRENEVVTRATTPLEDVKTTFKVWGYKNTDAAYAECQTVMPGYTVNWVDKSATTTTANTDGWDYVNQQSGTDPEQSIKYWDWTAKAYRFFAVAGSSGVPVEKDGKTIVEGANYWTTQAEGAAPEFTFYVNTTSPEKISEMAYFTPLWFSTGNLADYPDKEFGKPVKLEFTKPYSRVRFMFTYVYAQEGHEMTGISFKPADATKKIARYGSVKVTYPITGATLKESYTITQYVGDYFAALDKLTEYYEPENASKVYTETDEGWYAVVPNIEQGNYQLKVTIDNETKTITVPAAYMQWQPGYSYTYIFKVTEEGGVEIDLVQSAFREWDNVEINHYVYNW